MLTIQEAKERHDSLVQQYINERGQPRKYGLNRIDGYEQHHVVTRAECAVLGWSDEDTNAGVNIVYVTPAEHFELHILRYWFMQDHQGFYAYVAHAAKGVADFREATVKRVLDNTPHYAEVWEQAKKVGQQKAIDIKHEPCDCGCNLTNAQCAASRSAETQLGLCGCGCEKTIRECSTNKAMKTRSEICECREIKECDGSLLIVECMGIKGVLARKQLCSCGKIEQCNGSITIDQCNAFKIADICGSMCECGCEKTIRECANDRTVLSKKQLCNCGAVDECDGTLSVSECSSYKTAFQKTGLSKKDKLDICAKFSQGSSVNSLTKEYQVVKQTIYNLLSENNILAKGTKVLTTEKESMLCEDFKKYSMFADQLSEKYGVSESTVHKTLNKFGHSYPTAWWFQGANREKKWLVLWKNVKQLRAAYDDITKISSCGPARLMNSVNHFKWAACMTKKRAENYVKLFRNESEFQEMLELHAKTDFDALIENCEK
ncbi:hypothetical protein [Vibrio harveyi]